MKILAVDSSSVTASVALSDNEYLIGETFINAGLTHSQTLMPMIESLIKQSGISIGGIDAFAVTVGPGSFTGVRIGVSVVKGMAMVFDRPCIAVSSLYSMAFNLFVENEIICACMDARREQIYNALFERDGTCIKRIVDDRAISAHEVITSIGRYGKKVNFVGDGAEMCYNIAKGVLDDRDRYLSPERMRYIRASSVTVAAYSLYCNGIYTDPQNLSPVYLRMPQAERELKERNSSLKLGR